MISSKRPLIFIFLNIVSLKSSVAQDAAKNRLLWIAHHDGAMKLVSLVDSQSIISLPSYPGSTPQDGGGPIFMEFFDGKVTACGNKWDYETRYCYAFDGVSWIQMPSYKQDHCPDATRSKGHYMEGLGLWFGGDEGCYSEAMTNELLIESQEWLSLPIASPYNNFFPASLCSVALNASHIFFSGGDFFEGPLTDTWILDLQNLVWTPSTPLPFARTSHGCVTTSEGDVLVAGGYPSATSIQIFNMSTLNWQEAGNLPSEMKHYDNPTLLLWKSNEILLERYTDHIWMRQNSKDGVWRKLASSMGRWYDGHNDAALLVPDSFAQLCIDGLTQN